MFPIEILALEGRGRGLVATRPIGKDEVVLRCAPTVLVPSYSTCQQNLMCCGCFRSDLPVARCERCKAVCHCAPCRNGRSGIIHKDECDALSRLMAGIENKFDEDLRNLQFNSHVMGLVLTHHGLSTNIFQLRNHQARKKF